MPVTEVQKRVNPIFAAMQLLPVVFAALMAWLLPGAPVWASTLSLSLVWCLAAWAYRSCRNRSAAGWAVLFLAQGLLTAGVLANVWYFTTASGGTWTDPVLHNWDAKRAWQDALAMLGRPNESFASAAQHGYTLVMLAVSGWHGLNILTPLAFNALCAMLTIILTGVICASAAPEGRERSYSAWGMGLLAAVCYFMANSTVLLKDALMCLASAAMLLGCLRIGRGCRWTWLIVAAVAIQALVRPGALLPSALLLLMACGLTPGRTERIRLITIALIAVAVWCVQSMLIRTAPPLDLLITCDKVSGIIYPDDSHQAWHNIQGDYTALPWYTKLLWLPASLLVECITPLPWNFARDTIFGPAQAYAHVAYPWYAILGLLIYFAAMLLRRAPRAVSAMFVWALIVATTLAYMNGGNISRHSLPLLPALIPAAVYTLKCAWHRRSLRIWYAGYVLAVCGGLFLVRFLQHNYV